MPPPLPSPPLAGLPSGEYLPEVDGHRIWWCKTGPSDGVPVLVLHGGPGGRTRAAPFGWFAGLPVRVIAFDQRGCGRSEPAGSTQHNTLSHLLLDIERLREHLGLERWAVAAGSWGALLAVAYGATAPQRIDGLFLRSAFLGSDAEVAQFFAPWSEWLGETGAAWLGAARPGTPLELLGDVAPLRGAATPVSLSRLGHAWQAFEQAQAQPGGLRVDQRFTIPADARDDAGGDLPPSLAVQAHYLLRHCFVSDAAVWAWLAVLDQGLAGKPVALLHGLADSVCQSDVTQLLATRWPHSTTHWVHGAGHDMDSAPMRAALTLAAREWVGAQRAARP
jgi:proline iminopeptidase